MKIFLLCLAIYLFILFKAWLLVRFGGPKQPFRAAILPALALDCLLNLGHGGSFRHTLSGEAWNQREHKYWGWTYRFIDWLFFLQLDHCRIQSEREIKHGSVWKAWRFSWGQS